MEQLLGDKYSAADASFIRELFLQRLPSDVRMVLASIESTDLNQLANTADKIMEVSTPAVNAVSPAPPTPVDQLRSEVADLRKLVEKLLRSDRSRTPRRSPTPTSSILPSNDICWYHQRFGR